MYNTVIKQLIENKFIYAMSITEEDTIIKILREGSIDFSVERRRNRTRFAITDSVANALHLHNETKHLFVESK